MQPFNTELDWLWLGTWSMGGEGWGPTDLRESRRTVECALKAGLRRFDTAPVYSRGHSERLLGECVRGMRKEVFLSTKGGLEWDGNRVFHEAKPGQLRLQLERSLDRLQTDYVDLYQLHWPDPEVPISTSLGALEKFKQEGLIREWGMGNFSAKQIVENVAENANVLHQLPCSLLSRNRGVIQAGADQGRCRAVAYSPFEQGLLCRPTEGRSSEDIGNRDVRRRNPHFRNPGSLEWVREFHARCKKEKVNPMTLALDFLIRMPTIFAVVAGPRTEWQLQSLIASAREAETWKSEWPISPEFSEWINSDRCP